MVKDMPKVNPSSRLEQSIHDLTDMYRKHQVYIKRKYKISALEMEIIQLVCVEGRKKMKEIGDHFEVKLSTLTSIIDKIERGRLVKRVNSRSDRRVLFLEATRKGRDLYQQYSDYIQVIAHALEQSMPQDRLQALLEGIDLMTEYINNAES
jgi:DNA-binding MarR family transcriptional regulator